MKRKLYYFVAQFLALFGMAQSSNLNYVTTRTALIPTTSSLTNNSNYTQIRRATQYFDDLGRPIQQVIRKGSADGYDVITNLAYDSYGREHLNYLPYSEEGAASGDYRSAWETEIDTFYGEQDGEVAYEDTYYYYESIYPAAAINRLDSEYGAGTSWRSDNRSVSYSYRPNSESELIPYFEVNNSSSPYYVSYETDYDAGELWLRETKDENLNKVREFTDKQGRTVCKQVEYIENTFASTYYLYDHSGNLVYVIPPEGVNSASANWESYLNDLEFKKKWLFRYEYDSRNRLILKQVPGAEPVYMIYDVRDRLVMLQNGNQRSLDLEQIAGNVTKSTYENASYFVADGSSLTLAAGFEFSASDGNSFIVTTDESAVSAEWLYTKYDKLNRPVMTGLVTIEGKTREDLQNEITTEHTTLSYVGDASGNVEGYSKTSFPGQQSDEVLTLSYYDSYEFTGHNHWTLADFTDEESAYGLSTGAKKRVLGGDFLESVVFFDSRLRVSKSQSQNHLGGMDIIEYVYDNVVHDVVRSKLWIHEVLENSVEITENYTYDHMDRLKAIECQINSEEEETIAIYDYNEIGELIEKNVGNNMQSIDFRYNIRGWLSTINNGTSFDDSSDKFGMELLYTSASSNYINYNGNVGQVNWKHEGQTTSSYFYNYDKMNRITQANSETNGYNGYYNLDNLSYDLNGNILTLNRAYDGETVDILDYEYQGNQLTSVGDEGTNGLFDERFSEGKSTDEYLYDANGNMIKDANKGITSITYNYLNLPEEVSYSDSNGDEQTVTYTYDAMGAKLKKVSTAGATIDYIGGIQYKEGVIDFIMQEEGRYSFTSERYEYDLKDHLGNVRATIIGEGGTTEPGYSNSYVYGAETGDDLPAYGNSAIVSSPVHSGDYSYEISGTSSHAAVIPVNAGDDIYLSLWAFADYNSGGYNIDYYNSSYVYVGNVAAETFTITSGGEWVQVIREGMTAPGDGYIYLTLKRPTAYTNVYYDDIEVIISKDDVVSDMEVTVIQRDDYYPFGGTFNSYVSGDPNNYLYQGKEEQDELGTYDFGARMYDQWLGRSWQQDPLADAYLSFSPYSWVANNPLTFLDPTGMALNDYKIYENGEIVMWETDDTSDSFTYVDEDGNETCIGTYDKNDSGLIQLGDIDDSDGSGAKISTKEGNDNRLYISGNALASILGASADSGEEIFVNSVSESDGASPSPSTSHKDGKNMDIRYAGNNGARDAIDYEGSKADFDKIDQTASSSMNTALNKFGYKDIRSSTLNVTSTVDGKEVTTSYSVSGTTHLKNHYDHQHLQGYNPSITTRPKLNLVTPQRKGFIPLQ